PLTIASNALAAKLPSLDLAAIVRLDGKSPITIDGLAQFDKASLDYKPQALTASDISAKIPFLLNTSSQAPGSFHLPDIRLGQTVLPPIDGTIALTDTRA